MRLAKEILEEEVRQVVVQGVKSLGGLWVKNQRRQGYPDDSIYWLEGVHDIIEFKRPVGGRFEPLQMRTIEKLRRMGHSVLIINTKEQAHEYLMSRLPYALPGAVRLFLKRR